VKAYQTVEKYLNVLSGPVETASMTVKDMVKRIMADREGMDTLAKALAEHAGLLFRRIEDAQPPLARETA
jgi:hypothetical protein